MTRTTLASNDSGSLACLELLQLLEERADLRRRGELVGDAGEGRPLLRPCGRAERRHLRFLVPAQERGRAPEVGYFAETPQKIVEAGPQIGHGAGD